MSQKSQLGYVLLVFILEIPIVFNFIHTRTKTPLCTFFGRVQSIKAPLPSVQLQLRYGVFHDEHEESQVVFLTRHSLTDMAWLRLSRL